MNFGLAYKSYLPSVHPFDLLVGLIGAAALKAVIYFKGKNAKEVSSGERNTALPGGAMPRTLNLLLTRYSRIMCCSPRRNG